MRQYFFLGILIVGVLSGIVYFIWLVVSALYRDWAMGKDVDRIRVDAQSLREKRKEDAERRLDNGCDHEFGETFGGFPPQACHKCGLERNRPSGPCDHVWRMTREAVPSSYCEKCGKKYTSPSAQQ